MTARRAHKVIAALNLSRRVNDLPAKARSIVLAMTGNPYFPSPNPPLGTVSKHIDELVLAGTLAITKVAGAVVTREAKALVVRQDLDLLRMGVQYAADLDPENAVTVVESAGMSVKQVGARGGVVFDATEGETSGSVLLAAEAHAGTAAYEWQYSVDMKTWIDVPPTIQSRVVVRGLTPGVLHYFRYRPVTRTGRRDWSQIIHLMVR